MTLSRGWTRWKELCLLVKPATVIRWHRAGFQMFWRWKCNKGRKPGRPGLSPDIRALIRRVAQENPLWGAPRIHGELLKLGIVLSERSVARWMPGRPVNPKRAQSWQTFLENHRDVLAAMDLLVVPTWNFGLLYVLVILEHGRRMVRHVHVTAHPTAAWVRQQLREAFPFDETPRYLLFDHDAIFSAVKPHIASMGMIAKQTTPHCPWQNGVCERFMGTLRRDLLDHVIVLDEAHLLRLLKDFLHYYHEDRTHLFLGKDCPRSRSPDVQQTREVPLVAKPRCGGLHHRYGWGEAA